MISGYFITGTENEEKAKQRIRKIWVPTFIYSVFIPVVLYFVGYIQLSGKDMLMLFLPIMSNQYWFSTCFIAVMLLLPFLGPALRNMDDKSLTHLVVCLLLLDCIQPVLGHNAFSNIGYGLLHAVTMYIIGYFLKRKKFQFKASYCALVFVICVLIICIITILSMLLLGERNRTIADYNSILMVIQSISLFCLCTNIKIRKIHFSKIAPYIFGVYLLNDNQYAREFLWQDLFHCSDFYSSKLLPVHFIVVTIGFVIVALIIEWIRINSWKLITRKKRRKVL